MDAFNETIHKGFVDGDHIEQFLTFPSANDPAAKKVLKGSNNAEAILLSFDGVVQRLEQLQQVH